MCMGYAKEIRAWVCEDAGSERESMMAAWGRAFEASPQESEPPTHFLKGSPAVMPKSLAG